LQQETAGRNQGLDASFYARVEEQRKEIKRKFLGLVASPRCYFAQQVKNRRWPLGRCGNKNESVAEKRVRRLEHYARRQPDGNDREKPNGLASGRSLAQEKQAAAKAEIHRC
jgi:hypothetical protein